MPPTFNSSAFMFEEGEAIPRHIEGQPQLEARNPIKIWLEEEDPVERVPAPVAIDIDDLPTAGMLRAARLRQLGSTGSVSEVHIRKPGQYLRTSEVAQLFRVSERAVTDWARRGRLPAIKTPGGHRRYPTEAVKRLLEESGHNL